MNYYNENDPEVACWLLHLIRAGVLPDGDVDTRDIREIRAGDLDGYCQHHFFAGIGGWAAALLLAGWPAARPVWTGSCPCQSYSTAGKQLGAADPRHLWPVWFDLIRQRGPDVIFGEQVENAIKHGWLDGVSTDLEGEGYACGHAVLGAHSVNAPHQRLRLWFVGQRISDAEHSSGPDEQLDQSGERRDPPPSGDAVSRGGCRAPAGGGISDPAGTGRQRGASRGVRALVADENGGLGDSIGEGSQGLDRDGNRVDGSERKAAAAARSVSEAGLQPAPWDSAQWVECRDNRRRRFEPGIEPLVNGLPGRVALLRGAGNAIVPQVGAMFVRAFLEHEDDD